MKKMLAKCFLMATVCGAAFSTTQICQAQGKEPFPPEMYRQGEIVMAGTADQAPAGYRVKKVLPNAGLVVLAVEKGRERQHVEALAARGKKSGLNLKYQAFFTPLDTYYHLQWNMPMVQSEAAWDITAGQGVIVAVLDTGLKMGGPDGIACTQGGTDIVNSDTDPTDGDGHGTHVSGTIAQTTDNATGVAGLAHDACIMPVKVLDDNGSGTSADLAEGVAYAVKNNASVINMSLGWKAQLNITADPILDPRLKEAHAAGVTIVCASGNDSYRKQVSYPAVSPYTIAVGAVDINKNVASYSNGGTGLDLVAPGGGGTASNDAILQETFDDTGWHYFYYTGTSMATPHVTAAAALLYAENPSITPEEVRTRLTSTALDRGTVGWDSDYGHGLLQTYAALNPYDTCLDGDGDGWSTCDSDCDDANPAINPAAAEVCGDGMDNNCDGVIDEGCQVECVDKDADGWTTCDGDCNDANRFVNPGRTDTAGRWGRDGVDNDCDGVVDR